MSEVDETLKKEIVRLYGFMTQLKTELAGIRQSHSVEDRFQSMAEELEAIVGATEGATNTILGAAERIDNAVTRIDELGSTDKVMLDQTEKIKTAIGNIFEASSFQDITGQRISKVMKSVTAIDDHVGRMVHLWGAEQVASVDIGDDKRTDDEKLLNGPQVEGDGISQDEIDKLFG